MPWMVRPFSSITHARARRILNVLGTAILVAGLGSTVALWRVQERVNSSNADQQVANPAAPLAPSDSRKQSREIEIYYGKTGLLMERWSERAQNLMHGKPLAKVIGVVTVFTAGGCFFIAARLRV